jgi:hypothetical protein
MGAMESERIALDDREEVVRWCRWFGCSEVDLIRAVWKVGARAVDVDRFLNAAEKSPEAPASH